MKYYLNVVDNFQRIVICQRQFFIMLKEYKIIEPLYRFVLFENSIFLNGYTLDSLYQV